MRYIIAFSTQILIIFCLHEVHHYLAYAFIVSLIGNIFSEALAAQEKAKIAQMSTEEFEKLIKKLEEEDDDSDA